MDETHIDDRTDTSARFGDVPSSPTRSTLHLALLSSEPRSSPYADGSPNTRCCRFIHGELSRLALPTWRFICIHNEKSFRTVWTELAQEFPEVFNHCTEQTLWNAARD
jgi:hypothetical protein